METHEVVVTERNQWLTAGPDSERASLSASSTKRDSRSEFDYAAVDKLPSQAPSDSGEDDGKGKGKKDKDEKLETVSFTKLFRHADQTDKFLIILGFIGAAANGAGLPVMTIVFGNVYQAYSVYTIQTENKPNITDSELHALREELRDTVADEVIKFLIIGAGVFIAAYFQMACWMYAGQRQARRVRQLYFKSVLRQEIGWFDSTSTGDLTTRISGDISVFQEGISEKLGSIIQYVSTFIIGFVIAFTKGWKMSLVLVCGSFPLLAISGAIMAKAIASSTVEGQTAYASAGSVAEQVISGIRTVVAFGSENREIKRYMSRLNEAYRVGKKKAIISGIGLGVMMFIIFASYGLGFWFGGKLVANDEQTPGEVLNIFFAVVIGAFSLGNAAPHFSSVGGALGAAASLYKVIDRAPQIDSDSSEGKTIQKSTIKGRIEFKDVSFHYPQRPDVPVLKNFNLTIEPGQTVALVGTSGSGKSTIVSLLERYYDPISGSIYLDGEDLTKINLKSLRSSIGLVGQEPVLFAATIAQNIKWGAMIDEKEPTMEEVMDACRKSNAHEFITDLSEQYETDVGEKGSLMSGGQKQRIAIARALIKNPPILLLDEATSALDTESERLVQSALDNAASDRTTIVVAHRLSTIKNADKIVVMSKGEILETGRHDELIAQEGVYYGLVRAQELKTAKTTKAQAEDEDEDEEGSASSESKTGDVAVTIAADEKRPRAMRRMSTKVSTVQSARDEPTEEEIAKAKGEKMPIMRVIGLNKPEYGIMFLGAVGASVNGAIMPLFSLAFSAILEALANPDPDEVRRKANFWAGMFVVLAAVAFFANFGQIGLFALSGERLTRRLRSMTFTAILKQEIAFFDDEKNSTGALTSKLAVDASRVEGLAGSLMGTIIQTVVTLITGLAIAFAYGWKFTLVILGAVPVIGIAAYMELRALGGYGQQTRQAYEQSGQIVQQSISNMRTIAALNRERTFREMYDDAIRKPFKVSVRHNFYSAIWFAASQGLQYYVWSLAWWYGAELIADGEYDQRQAFNVLFAVLLSAMAIGQMGNFAPNSAKAKIAAISIFELIDRKSAIDVTEIDEKKERPAPVTGDARIVDGQFVYPARPNVPVLRGLNVDIKPGQTVALVGGSGSGKSTVVSLLLRFYDLVSGTVEVEKTPVERWNLEYMRSCFALVGQEPVLFDMTIGENIAYGKVGCTEEEIKQAAVNANIHNFISGLPLGYKTPVGEKGAQLSGGQKQRVAIARALIRQPKLLLLDEATSALDSESEKVVQDALDKAASGRTTVTIAHRLSTIQDADVIYVIKKGRVIEVGNHMELIAKKGLYQELVNKQMLMSKKGKQ